MYHQKLLTNKTLADSCLFTFLAYVTRHFKMWMVKFGEPPVKLTRQIRQGFPLPNIHAIQYSLVPRSYTTF